MERRVRLTYSQPEDSDGRCGVEDQHLAVETFDAGAGDYVVIKTERWAINDREEGIRIINRIFDDLDNPEPPQQTQ